MSQQRVRNYDIRTKPNENDVEESVSSQTKRQFGVSGQNKGMLSSGQPQGLKQQISCQQDDQKLQQLTLLTAEPSLPTAQPNLTAPQKRTEAAVGLTYPKPKKQNVREIEGPATYRRSEQEQQIDWEPEGYNLDYSPFEHTAAELSYEQTDSMFMNDVNANTTQRLFVAAEVVDTPMGTPKEASINTVEKEEELAMEDEGQSTITERCSAKEIEIPYEPHKSCIVNFDAFTRYADFKAYEWAGLFDKDDLEFVFDDIDAIQSVTINPIDTDSLTFQYDSDIDNEIEMYSEDDFDVPFSDHLFDIDHFIQNNPLIVVD